jgi:hypothetical protein
MIITGKEPMHNDEDLFKAGPSGLLDAGTDALIDPPPPPFEEQQTEQRLLIDLTDGSYNPTTSDLDIIAEPPPDFAQYNADYFETGSGDIVSHDPHLNTDGM